MALFTDVVLHKRVTPVHPYVWEEGPNSYQPGDAILTVACDAGMQNDILLADPNSDRFVLWDKELRALPKDIPTAVLGGASVQLPSLVFRA